MYQLDWNLELSLITIMFFVTSDNWIEAAAYKREKRGRSLISSPCFRRHMCTSHFHHVYRVIIDQLNFTPVFLVIYK